MTVRLGRLGFYPANKGSYRRCFSREDLLRNLCLEKCFRQRYVVGGKQRVTERLLQGWRGSGLSSNQVRVESSGWTQGPLGLDETWLWRLSFTRHVHWRPGAQRGLQSCHFWAGTLCFPWYLLPLYLFPRPGSLWPVLCSSLPWGISAVVDHLLVSEDLFHMPKSQWCLLTVRLRNEGVRFLSL